MRVLRKRRFPVAATAVLVLLVLATLGIVYGNWAQTLSINGSVTTAEINVKWTVVGKACPDNEEGTGKNVGVTQRNLVADKIIMTTTNGYPGYQAKCNVTVKNNGKLPVRVGGLTFKPFDKTGASDLTGCSSSVVINVKGVVESASVTCDQLTINIVNGTSQINEGGSDVFSITMQVQKLAQPNQNLAFQLQYCVEPAIESGQCVAKSNG